MRSWFGDYMFLRLNSDNIMDRLLGDFKMLNNMDIPDMGEIVKQSNDVYLAIAQKILNKALEYTPIDTGNLRNSAYIETYNNGYTVGYDCEYATYVHEIGFNVHKEPTKYKYLEDAAFEVIIDYWNETGVNIPVNILYKPLSVFIGCESPPGEKLLDVKNKEKANNNPYAISKLWDDLINYDPDKASDYEKAYYEKMALFFYHYRKHNTWAILQEWNDRLRHN